MSGRQYRRISWPSPAGATYSSLVCYSPQSQSWSRFLPFLISNPDTGAAKPGYVERQRLRILAVPSNNSRDRLFAEFAARTAPKHATGRPAMSVRVEAPVEASPPVLLYDCPSDCCTDSHSVQSCNTLELTLAVLGCRRWRQSLARPRRSSRPRVHFVGVDVRQRRPFKRECVSLRLGCAKCVLQIVSCIMIRGLLKYVNGSLRRFGIRT